MNDSKNNIVSKGLISEICVFFIKIFVLPLYRPIVTFEIEILYKEKCKKGRNRVAASGAGFGSSATRFSLYEKWRKMAKSDRVTLLLENFFGVDSTRRLQLSTVENAHGSNATLSLLAIF